MPVRYFCQYTWNDFPAGGPEMDEAGRLLDHNNFHIDTGLAAGAGTLEEAWAHYSCRDSSARSYNFRIVSAECRPQPSFMPHVWGDYTPVTRFALKTENISDLSQFLLLFPPPFNDTQLNLELDKDAMPDANSALEHSPDSLVRAKIVRDMSNGRLNLIVDARPLHDLLERMGVKPDGQTFAGVPGARYAVASPDFQVSTSVVLNRKYPASYNLSGIWSEPPTIPQLKKLGESIHTAVRKVLEHYRPIDISFNLVKVSPEADKRSKEVF